MTGPFAMRGLLYLYAAWKPERGRPIIAIGLLGKVLGPIGMVMTFSDEWPLRLAMLNLYNDLIWWLPFGLFLIRDTNFARRLAASAPWWCAALHLAAVLAMIFLLRQGTLAEPEAIRRATYISNETAVWMTGWALWMLSAASLVAFYAWWGSRLSAPLGATAAVLLAALGMVCDTSGESLMILVLVERAAPAISESTGASWDSAAFEGLERTITLLTAGAANGLYTLGGILLTLKTKGLPKLVYAAMWGTWIAGAGMTVAALVDHVGGMTVTTAVLFPLFIFWVVWLGWRWRPMCDA
jgi:hypothetical protein